MSKLTERFHLEKVRRVLSQPLENIGMKFEAQIGNGGSPRINADAQSRALYTCQRSLIYLGDLGQHKIFSSDMLTAPFAARYREMYSEPKEKNYSLAKTFYNLALRLMPENGNPFNQLAVIDTYESDDLLAVEHYFRRCEYAFCQFGSRFMPA
ncbi:hypothetical protein HK101_001276 [Irineochytrium annulatum]|nr:hypothetical protein HK101_001276 [Irineochytrium annulatum]